MGEGKIGVMLWSAGDRSKSLISSSDIRSEVLAEIFFIGSVEGYSSGVVMRWAGEVKGIMKPWV